VIVLLEVYAKESNKIESLCTILYMINKIMISIEQILKEGGGSVEDMSYGMFNNRGYYGYSSKVLKSGICKYFRREYFDKFEWCCMEMMLFGVSSSGLVSNLCNRLNILVMEKIIICQ